MIDPCAIRHIVSVMFRNWSCFITSSY